MVRIKPKIDGKGATTGFYTGPPPPPDTYTGVVKKMGLATIKAGDNAGQHRIALLLEIAKGPYKGAGVMHSLNITEQGKGYVNDFLHALTDGSVKQRETLESWFWDLGYDVSEQPDGNFGQQFTVIGKNFKPIGKPVTFITKADSYDGKPKAAIDRFVTPVNGGSEDEVAEEDSLASVADDSESVGAEDVSEEATEDFGDDDSADDPWS